MLNSLKAAYLSDQIVWDALLGRPHVHTLLCHELSCIDAAGQYNLQARVGQRKARQRVLRRLAHGVLAHALV